MLIYNWNCTNIKLGPMFLHVMQVFKADSLNVVIVMLVGHPLSISILSTSNNIACKVHAVGSSHHSTYSSLTHVFRVLKNYNGTEPKSIILSLGFVVCME